MKLQTQSLLLESITDPDDPKDSVFQEVCVAKAAHYQGVRTC